MPEIKASDLVLKVSESIDPNIFDISKYEGFLDALCGTREFQKEAIRVVLRYLLGKRYKNLRDLAKENYEESPNLKELYPTFNDFARHLQMPDKLSCTIDLATATGKSYVLYGIARIMLAEGAVDRVLVLAPSVTIERGLTEKFKSLSGDSELLRLIPVEAKVRNPRIINATKRIEKGDICIENIHSVYERTQSSVRDSLKGSGERTLILNDEAHHIFNPPGRDFAIKKWKEFLLNQEYNFHYIVGATGTAYIQNEYFTDVVFRYSLKEAIEERMAKTIRYVAEDSPGGESEKFQKVYDNHLENKRRWRRIKPLTIIITKDIAHCKKLTEKWIDFIAEKEGISKREAEKKILIVTSANEHKKNVARLDRVDSKEDPIEWITSVSMLTEGWDVKNVFQIVPHEERAFNSKLLIAQVLGRGLRIPLEYRGEQPVVTVFNHDNWAKNIRNLVDEVMEIEKRIHSYPIEKEKDYNFTIFQIAYEKEECPYTAERTEPYELLEKGFISFSQQLESADQITVYEKILTGESETKTTRIEYKMFPLEQVAREVVNRLKSYDMEKGTEYAKEFNSRRVGEIIKNSLKRLNYEKDLVSEENYHRVLQAFGVIKREKTNTLRYIVKERNLIELDTRDIRPATIGFSNLRKDFSVFYDEEALRLSNEEDKAVLNEVIADESLPRWAVKKVDNKYQFKTPLNVVFTASEPERKFVERLITNANLIDAWIKSRDTGFYSIEYSWQKGSQTRQDNFNPDFFIKKGKTIIVIETKDDQFINKISEGGDVAVKTRSQYKYALDHFNALNKNQKEYIYYFSFLTPKDFDNFFEVLKRGDFSGFKSQLDTALEES
ncbi:MAG: DEAD/DEAH box helicase family protein [candidate division WOR-3 bacterium]